MPDALGWDFVRSELPVDPLQDLQGLRDRPAQVVGTAAGVSAGGEGVEASSGALDGSDDPEELGGASQFPASLWPIRRSSKVRLSLAITGSGSRRLVLR